MPLPGIWHISAHRTVSTLDKISPGKFLPNVKIAVLTPKHDSGDKDRTGTARELPALKGCSSAAVFTRDPAGAADSRRAGREARGAGKGQQETKIIR